MTKTAVELVLEKEKESDKRIREARLEAERMLQEGKKRVRELLARLEHEEKKKY